ncbi:MAG: signal peptidase I [Bacteroidetes bacterium]|nr:signal peptidase I [Bacteroidota bacterium]
MNERRINNEAVLLQMLNESLLREGMGVRVRVTGSSMRPFIRDNDIAVVESISEESLKKGDIIVYRMSQQYVVHRLLKIIISEYETLYVCKGDSCCRKDMPVAAEHIYGRVSLIERGSRRFNMNHRKWTRRNKMLARISSYTPVFYRIARIIRKFVRRQPKQY